MLNAKLVVVGGDAKAAEISLSLPTTIGRGREANLTLPHPLVSRQHCELFEKEGMLHVRDLRSLNGTYVDSQRIETTSPLKPDQLLTIGNVTFRAIYASGEVIADNGQPAAQASSPDVIEFQEAASAESDRQVDSDRDGAGRVHSRSTVPGRKKTPSAESPAAKSDTDQLETVSAAELDSAPAPQAPQGSDVHPQGSNVLSPDSDVHSQGSDVLDEGPAESAAATPQHSIVSALRQAGVTTSRDVNATLSDIRGQLPESAAAQASSIDGLTVDQEQTPARPAGFSGVDIDVDEKAVEKVSSGEASLDSFIRKLPR